MTRKPIRVLVADDSTTLRTALCALLSEDPHLSIVGQAADGMEAVEKARALRPDVITMDVNMPRLDGLGATAAIMADAPARVLVISSVRQHRQLELSFKAMAAGALELIAKPEGGPDEMRRWARRVAESVRLMAEVPVVRRHRRNSSPPRPAVVHGAHVDVVGLVASTGGPPALAHVLGALPRELPIPLLLAQHIASGFTSGLVRWFASVCTLRVVVAQEGELPAAGRVYLAPDGCDLELDREGHMHTPRSIGLHCPSGNKLLVSLARAYGSRAAGFVLTGMGDDGAQGLLELKRAGGATYAQDEQSSVVFGMPQAAHACGASRGLLPLESIGPAILELCKERRT
ncbi:MAG TPA: chemotaxis-specific protein-glutamate methyltransferase CheB [Myxococcales bacterium]